MSVWVCNDLQAWIHIIAQRKSWAVCAGFPALLFLCFRILQPEDSAAKSNVKQLRVRTT